MREETKKQEERKDPYEKEGAALLSALLDLSIEDSTVYYHSSIIRTKLPEALAHRLYRLESLEVLLYPYVEQGLVLNIPIRGDQREDYKGYRANLERKSEIEEIIAKN